MRMIKRSEFSEETIYVIECPECKGMIETSEDPNYIDELHCDECDNSFELKD